MSREILSNNIRFYRRRMGLTQSALAEALFIVPQTVSKWESGISEPDAEKLCLLADLFGVSLDNLMRSAAEYKRGAYIAIDGGGTKTAFALFDEDGKVIELLTLGGCNPNAHGVAECERLLCEGIDILLRRGFKVKGLYAGISGASSGKNREEISGYLKKKYPYFKSFVEGDIHNVIHSVDGDGKAIAVICGTGSVVYGYDGHSLCRYGGWGYLFDDAGSGFDMGRDLFRYCLSLEDRGESDELYIAVTGRLGGRIFDNVSALYSGGKDLIASFAPIVFEFYDKGHGEAVRIVEKCAERLSELIILASNSGRFGKNVIIAGGLTKRRDILERLISKRIGQGFKLMFADKPPIVGAVVKCLKLYGEGKKDGDIAERIYESMKNKGEEK